MSIKIKDTTNKYILDIDETTRDLVVSQFSPQTFSVSEGDWIYTQTDQWNYQTTDPLSKTPYMPLQDSSAEFGPNKTTLPLAGGYDTTFGIPMESNIVYFIPFRETPGFILDNINMGIWTAGTGTAKVAVYTSKRVTQGGYTQLGPGTPYEIGTINVGTSGQKTIININLTLPESENGIYWFAVMPENTGGFITVWNSNRVVFTEWMSGVQLGATLYRNLSYKTITPTPTYDLPTNIQPIDIVGVTGDVMSITYGVR